jgi:hypothetical protein
MIISAVTFTRVALQLSQLEQNFSGATQARSRLNKSIVSFISNQLSVTYDLRPTTYDLSSYSLKEKIKMR